MRSDVAAALWRDPAYREKCVTAARAGRARVKAGEGFIYLAECIRTNELKIGFSLDPKKRMPKAGCNTHRGPCRLLAQMPATISQERALHRQLGGGNYEFYPRSILSHPAIPERLRA